MIKWINPLRQTVTRISQFLVKIIWSIHIPDKLNWIFKAQKLIRTNQFWHLLLWWMLKIDNSWINNFFLKKTTSVQISRYPLCLNYIRLSNQIRTSYISSLLKWTLEGLMKKRCSEWIAGVAILVEIWISAQSRLQKLVLPRFRQLTHIRRTNLEVRI